MSNEVTLFNEKFTPPAYLKDMGGTDAVTDALAGKGFGKRISIRGGVFRMIVDGEEVAVSDERALDVVVVAAAPHVARMYYAESYQEGTTVQPTCWSADGVKPEEQVKAKQAEQCAKCPQNISGSGNGDTRACRFAHRIAVVLDNDLDGNVYQVSLPSLSIFGKGEGGKLPLQAYAKFLKSHQVPITAVVTEMRFDVSATAPKLVFKAVRPLQEDEFRVCQKQGASDDAKNAITFTVATMDAGDSDAAPEVLKAAAATAKAVQKAATQAPVEVETDADDAGEPDPSPAPAAEAPKKGFRKTKVEVSTLSETSEPVKKESKKAEPVDSKKKVQDILAQWGSDE